MLRVVNYIHLNPVTAGMVSLEKLDNYALSSFPKLLRRKPPECLRCDWLVEAGLEPGVSGMRNYWRYLESVKETDPKRLAAIERSLNRGWYIGSTEGKKALLKDLREGGGLSDPELARLDAEAYAMVLLEEGLAVLGKDREDLQRATKGCFWKASLCRLIHQRAGVSNAWLARHLHLGHPQAVSRIRNRLPESREERKLEKHVQGIGQQGKG